MPRPWGTHRNVAPRPSLIVFEPHPDPARIIPSKPLGPWALRPVRELLEASDRSRPVILDLTNAPVNSPGHVASILWIDDIALELGVRLEIFTPDMAGAELLDFAGVHAPVFAGTEPSAAEEPAGEPGAPRRDSAY
jgi:hypothetical protein